MQATPKVLMERIKMRGRRKGYYRNYLKQLTEAYNHYFFNYDATPLLVVIPVIWIMSKMRRTGRI